MHLEPVISPPELQFGYIRFNRTTIYQKVQWTYFTGILILIITSIYQS